ncbi:FxSxx-COOH system tetratricopeptide repeat protein [Streptomyces canus]|uniref:FxSxx-COOH system tetratricopeptide repeat protein n=1 Tax=Streptomyces canus TaxID=58343 RepID=UPI002E2B73BE|nr:FxSxx-COOH system tetratricopeptide repeat protein [Streptomyces canus]
MTEGQGERDPVRGFGDDLRGLYVAAGSPQYETLARRVGVAQSVLHEWVNGASIPSDKHRQSLDALVTVLGKLVRGEHRTYPTAWWEARRRAARQHRRTSAGRGGSRSLCRVLGPVPPEAECYQDRPHLRRTLETAAADGTSAPCELVTGMGGVGKTQLAACHARSALAAKRVDVLLWVTAASRAAVVDAYTSAAVQLFGAREDDPQAAHTFLNWLAIPPGSRSGSPVPGARWLIVLDDVPHAEAVRGLLPPPSPHGQTLITTRNRDAALLRPGRRRVEVDRFSREEAVEYLTAKLEAHGRNAEPVQVEGLAEDLGRLPLALSQTVPYMINRQLDCAAYRRRLADHARTLKDVLPPRTGLPDEQDLTVAAAWDLSIDLADQLPPQGLARPLLQLLSVLDPNGIPAAAITSAPARAHLARGGAYDAHPSSDAETTADDATDALWNLHQFSLVEHSPQVAHRAVRVHRLVQRAVQERFSAGSRRHCGRTAADALVAAWPDTERDTDLVGSLRANAAVLYEHFADALWEPEKHPVLSVMGHSLLEAGQVIAARDHWRRLAETARSRLGPDHRITLETLGTFANCLGESGDTVGAAAVYAELVQDAGRVLGARDRSVLITRSNRAMWRGRSGAWAQAADELTEILKDVVEVLGADSPETFQLRGNLAAFRGSSGDAAGAVEASAELLEIQRETLGPDHPNTLTTWNNYAYFLGESGEVTGAVEAFAELLEYRRRVLGDDHPMTLATRGNHAFCRGQAGDAAGAVKALTELLEHRRRVLGEGHPDTVTSRSNLALWKGWSGDAAGAAAEFAFVAADAERVFGADHPDTLVARARLGLWRGRAGDPVGAVAAYAELLEGQRRILRDDHDRIRSTLVEIARWSWIAGDREAALAAHDQLLENVTRHLDPHDPAVLDVRTGRANHKGHTGDPAGAADELAHVVSSFLRTEGADSPHTLSALRGVLMWRMEAGDIDAAALVYARLTESLRRALEAGPQYLGLRHELACGLGEAGDREGAATAFGELTRNIQRTLGADASEAYTAASAAAYWRWRAGKGTPLAAHSARRELFIETFRVAAHL